MKKLSLILVVAVLIASVFTFAGCGEKEPAPKTEKNASYDEVVLAADFEDGTWTQLASENEVIPSEVDGLIPTDSKYFYFEPYSTYGYKVRGFSNITEGRPTDLIIPNTYNNKPVVMIDTGSFRDDTTITSVKMGSNMKLVYANSFRGCTSLASVVLGTNVSKIHHAAFRDCTSLKEIVIPARVSVLEGNLFSGCTSLEKVEFAKCYYNKENGVDDNNEPTYKKVAFSVTDFAVCVFADCTSLKTITLPEKLKTIGSGCFRNSGLSGRLTIPSSVQTVGTLAFSNCTELSVTFRASDSAVIADDAFFNVGEYNN